MINKSFKMRLYGIKQHSENMDGLLYMFIVQIIQLIPPLKILRKSSFFSIYCKQAKIYFNHLYIIN